jgi:branched-chain amino acid transport system ATP-binding protein
MTMLEVKNLSISYGKHRALENVSLTMSPGEIVVILGANGAGKSSLLRSIGGLCEGSQTGAIHMDGKAVLGKGAHQIVEAGVAMVPEGRGVFGELSVRENLALGAYPKRAQAEAQANLDRILSLFPKLTERQDQMVRTMSGGEQQMVAIGRAMMSAPSILMLDEPSLGLSPILCKELFSNLSVVRKSGLGILLVEQNAKQSLAIADRGYLLENGQIIGEDAADKLTNDPAVQKAYLGGSAQSETVVPVHTDTASPQAADEDNNSSHTFVTAYSFRGREQADDLVGNSIDGLVQEASSIQSNYLQATRSPGESPLGRKHASSKTSTHLEDIMATIEQSAIAARKPSAKKNAPRKHSLEITESGDLPEIKVYKKPEIAIYRRTETGSGNSKMTQVKGGQDGQNI